MFAIPTDLKEILLNFYGSPAFYTIIYAIIKSKAINIDELKSFTKKYYLIGDWEDGGMPSLFRKGILEGTNAKFQVAPKYKEHLENWVEQNNNRLNAMSNAFRRIEDCNNENEVIKFKERVETLNSRLKF